jgi:hypothetical protein
LIDDMMKRGDWEVAYRSCQRMEEIPSPKNHRVLLRQAVLDLIAKRDSLTDGDLNRLMDRFSQAADAGSDFAENELAGGSLTEYLQHSDIALDNILNELSRRVLESPESSGREMLLVSVLLTLDGQHERAALFTNETRTLAALSDSFRWQAVLRSLDRQLERDTLIAAKDLSR